MQELISISGKSKTQCEQALTMAGNDPNRAFEILMQLGFEDEGGLPDDQMYGQEYN